MKKPLALLMMLFAVLSAVAQSNWEFKKEKDGIRLFSRKPANSRFDDIKVEVDLPGTLEQLAAVLKDVGKYPDWAYGTKSGKVVKVISKNEFIYYSEIEVPWPATNRDLYANCKLEMDSVAHSLKVVANSLANYAPETDGLVRVSRSIGVWVATKLAGNKIHLQYTLELDPGGSVPAWVLNLFSTKGPMETFESLKQKMVLMNK